MQYLRKNLIIAGWVCMLLGTALVVADAFGGLLAAGGVLALTGVSLLLLGLNTSQEGMSPAQIAAWQPEASELPAAGRVMYRVDTTLDDPLRTSILCGACGELTTVDGTKPTVFACPSCKAELWEEEEEE